MTNQPIKWASEHDWFIGANDTSVMVLEESKIFTNFQQLRTWAGY